MKYDDDFSCHGGDLAGEQADNNNGNNRNIIEAGEYSDDLPKPLGRKLKHGSGQKRKQCDNNTRPFGNFNPL